MKKGNCNLLPVLPQSFDNTLKPHMQLDNLCNRGKKEKKGKNSNCPIKRVNGNSVCSSKLLKQVTSNIIIFKRKKKY